jgi:hypothetical protein
MMEENQDIPSEKKLPASLDRHLRSLIPEEEMAEFRSQLPEEFISDAKEGLDQLSENRMEADLKKLNRHLHVHLGHKRRSRNKAFTGEPVWTYWAVLLICVLALAGYLVVRMLLHR